MRRLQQQEHVIAARGYGPRVTRVPVSRTIGYFLRHRSRSPVQWVSR